MCEKNGLPLSLDVRAAALKVDAPRIVAEIEGQCLQWDFDLDAPAVCVARGFGVEDPIPVELEPGRILEQCIVADTIWIDRKEVAAALAIERVEDDQKVVIVAYRFALAQHLRHDAVRPAVPAAHRGGCHRKVGLPLRWMER